MLSIQCCIQHRGNWGEGKGANAPSESLSYLNSLAVCYVMANQVVAYHVCFLICIPQNAPKTPGGSSPQTLLEFSQVSRPFQCSCLLCLFHEGSGTKLYESEELQGAMFSTSTNKFAPPPRSMALLYMFIAKLVRAWQAICQVAGSSPSLSHCQFIPSFSFTFHLSFLMTLARLRSDCQVWSMFTTGPVP